MSFSNIFSSRRELKRLAKELTFWRSRSATLEKELKIAQNLLLERDFAWSDRFLTNKVGTFAINDETQARVYEKTKDDSNQTERQIFLQARRDEIYRDAREAGVSEAVAERDYRNLEPKLIEAWQLENNFG